MASLQDFVKDYQPLIQVIGTLIAAFFGAKAAFHYGSRMEPLRFEFRRKEIRFSKFHDKRLEALEALDAGLGKLLHETTALVQPFEATGSPQHWTREEKMMEIFTKRGERMNAALLALNDTQETKNIYIDLELNKKVTKFREEICRIVDELRSTVCLPAHHNPNYANAWERAIDEVKKARLMRVNLSDEFRRLLADE